MTTTHWTRDHTFHWRTSSCCFPCFLFTASSLWRRRRQLKFSRIIYDITIFYNVWRLLRRWRRRNTWLEQSDTFEFKNFLQYDTLELLYSGTTFSQLPSRKNVYNILQYSMLFYYIISVSQLYFCFVVSWWDEEFLASCCICCWRILPIIQRCLKLN